MQKFGDGPLIVSGNEIPNESGMGCRTPKPCGKPHLGKRGRVSQRGQKNIAPSF
jgi:hypothetical protein